VTASGSERRRIADWGSRFSHVVSELNGRGSAVQRSAVAPTAVYCTALAIRYAATSDDITTGTQYRRRRY
jgi:hypothetical protein